MTTNTTTDHPDLAAIAVRCVREMMRAERLQKQLGELDRAQRKAVENAQDYRLDLARAENQIAAWQNATGCELPGDAEQTMYESRMYIATLEDARDAAQARCAELERELDQTKSDYVQTKKRLAEALQEACDLRFEHESVTVDLNNAKTDAARTAELEDKVAELEAQLATVTAERAEAWNEGARALSQWLGEQPSSWGDFYETNPHEKPATTPQANPLCVPEPSGPNCPKCGRHDYALAMSHPTLKQEHLGACAESGCPAWKAEPRTLTAENVHVGDVYECADKTFEVTGCARGHFTNLWSDGITGYASAEWIRTACKLVWRASGSKPRPRALTVEEVDEALMDGREVSIDGELHRRHGDYIERSVGDAWKPWKSLGAALSELRGDMLRGATVTLVPDPSQEQEVRHG